MMEYFGFIESTEPLPQHFEWIKELKEKSESFAQKVSVFDKKRSLRIKECSSHVKLVRFKSGYTRFRSTKYCRVRGCPTCAIATANRSAQIIGRSIDLSDDWTHVQLAIPDGMGNASAKKALQRFTQRKNWKVERFLMVMGGCSQSQSLNLFCSKYPSGKSYLSAKRASGLWAESCKTTTSRCSVKSIRRKDVLNNTHSMIKCLLDSSMVPVDHLPDWLTWLRKARVFSFHGIKRTNRKPNEPSGYSANALHFGWMPNPEDDDFNNEYLLMPDPAQMLGNFD